MTTAFLLWSIIFVTEPLSQLPVNPPSPTSPILAERLDAVHKSPADPRARLELGMAYAVAEEYDLAMSELVESIRLNQDNKENLTAQANFQLGIVLAALERPDLATNAYREALRLGLQEAGVYSALGEALAADRKYDEAISEYRTAVHLSPNSFAARAGLALVLEASGKLDEALTEYEAALQSAPPADDHTVEAIKQRLRMLKDRRRL
ncbi:MAG TPA: tetratricopeptide repeat protein [Nitrospirales bacterium]